MKARIRISVAVALFSSLPLTVFMGSSVAHGSAPSTDSGSANAVTAPADCADVPDHAQLRRVVAKVVREGGNGGLGNDMWAVSVNRDGIVCAVAFSGPDRGAQWPGSRLIAAQKAYTANAFSLPPGSRGVLPGLALSTANLYSPVQPGGSLFGLQTSNPVDPAVGYAGDPARYGQGDDPMVGRKLGGVNVFGGGLALYTRNRLVGGIGVSGDTSCTDHVVAWKMRDALGLDNVPTGVRPRPDGDNIIFDIHNGVSASGYGHPECAPSATAVAEQLPYTHPLGR
ncbi:GlcG/HbpS family heme-binding protein [Streptomyces odontomachi]|uniref:GlcG/HbpS family heme-binding protein n=1 Tax=Streptomyces odontomachi TaxID=2944940 RepID=UPI00210B78E6|nr:heme-binding protein [Streptomyces sp. ODS25]